MGEVRLKPNWRKLLQNELGKPYFDALSTRVRSEYLNQTVYPPPKYIFRALDMVPPENVKVVILGQDPYHTPGVADGLAFSSYSKNPIPPSLQNIFKEIEEEYKAPCGKNPDLTRWAEQGVLLLNASLSVRKGEANSHAEYGWHDFTNAIIEKLSHNYEHIVFMLWGAFAIKKQDLINRSKHLVLTSVHPSPLSAHRGFFGNGHFKTANSYLTEHGRSAIDWS